MLGCLPILVFFFLFGVAGVVPLVGVLFLGVQTTESLMIESPPSVMIEGDALALPSQTAPPPLTPTRFAPPPALLQPDMTVRVTMPEDAFLNFRDAPSTRANVLALLKDGTLVTLLEYREAEGLMWWRGRVAGREGWLVEGLTDWQALVPYRTPTPAPR